MVSAHGRGRVRDADAFYSARLVSGHPLALDGRHARDAVDLASCARSTTQGTSQGGAFAHLMDQLNRALAVAKLDHASFHRDTQGDTGLDGIQTIFVA